MTWADIRRGDAVIVVHDRSRSAVRGVAVAVGTQWITVEVERGRPKRQRFQAHSGYGEYGARVHTEQSLAEEPRRIQIANHLRQREWWFMPLATLERVLAALDEDEEPPR